jgi:pyruvate formate lyase activating enzyme
MTTTPFVIEIARASREDGPGLRTVVFFKGCPLSCIWCHNPEAISPEQEIFLSPERCIQCGNCANGKSCFTFARQEAGRKFESDELIKIVLEDTAYYEASSGGVTFSGGEPCMHMDYLHRILYELKRAGVHTTIETCGYFDFGEFERKLLPWLDLVLYDIKIIDREKHKKYTGAYNDLIIDNFRRLLGARVAVLPRVPLVPGITATEENLCNIARFFRESRVNECEFIAYNPSGIKKRQMLRKERPADLLDAPLSVEEERKWIGFFNRAYSDAVLETTQTLFS